MIRLLIMLVVTLTLAPPTWAGSLNDLFTFATPVYVHDPATGLIEGHGEGGQFEGLGDVSFTLIFRPDPEGGHPLGRHLRFTGTVPELGIDEEETFLAGGLLLEGPFFHDGMISFGVLVEDTHPALGLGREFTGTWDIVAPTAVPGLASGLLLGLGGVGLVVWRIGWRLALLALAILLSGCAPTWVQTGKTGTALHRDRYECEMEAERVGVIPTGPYGGLILAIAQVSYANQRRNVTAKCMQLRGYEAAR
jgi:hypothetical protein